MNRIAYSSGIELRDSLVITYRIYCLKNPSNNEIFYVGKTTKKLKERLTGHIGSINSNGSNQIKNDYIKSILETGARPVIEEIEAIFGTCFIHKAEASAREYYWINHYQSSGIKLTNHFGVKTDPLCIEWEKYLNEIKDGKGDLNHYYCGTTNYGIPVYDEEKMKDDGFLLEKGKTYEETAYRIPIWTYEKIYDDDSPDYIKGSLEEI